MSSARMKTMFGRRRACARLRRAAMRDMEPRAAARSICRREMFGDMAGSLHAVTGHRVGIPIDAGARAIRDDGMAVADLDRILQDWRRPVDVLEPVAGRRHREQVRAELRIEM